LAAVLRFVGNVLLAAMLVVLTAAILLAGYGAVMASVWEIADIDEGVSGGAWAEIDGRKIYHQVVGAEHSTPVLLVHGLGVEGLQVWNDTALALSKSGLRVISADLSGFGYSSRDTVNGDSLAGQAAILGELLDQQKVQRITVVGQGWGGAVALRLAQDRPELVRQVVLVAPLLDTGPTIWPPVLKAPYVGRGVAWVLASGGPIWRVVRRAGFQDPSLLTADLLDNMRRPTHVRGTIDVVLSGLAAKREGISALDLSKVQVPVLIIAGAEDRFVRVEALQEVAERFPDATLVTIDDAGHYVHIEQSTVVVRSLVEFCLAENP